MIFNRLLFAKFCGWTIVSRWYSGCNIGGNGRCFRSFRESGGGVEVIGPAGGIFAGGIGFQD